MGIASAVIVLAALAIGLWRWRTPTSPRPLEPPPASLAPSEPRPRPASLRPLPLRLVPAVAEPDTASTVGAFEGRVLSSATGRGVPGAELTFEHAGITASAIADAEGVFRFEPREAGTFRLALVVAASYVPYAPEWGHSPIAFVARPGERVRGIAVYLSPVVDLTGIVRDPEGKPVAGAAVRILEPTATRSRGEERLLTDAQGEVHFTAPDDALIEARHPSYAPARARIDFTARVHRRVVLKLGERDGGAPLAEETIAGRVIDARGTAVAGGLVRAEFTGDLPRAADLRPSSMAVTDDEGHFLLEGLDPGQYEVMATSEGTAPARADAVIAGTRDLVLRLGKGGTIRGTVRDRARGSPIASFTVVVSAKVGPIERQPYTHASTIDAAGHYEVKGIAPGAYAVTVVAQGYAPSEQSSLIIPDPPADVTLDFNLSRGGRVSGTVVSDGSNKPLEGARVSLEGLVGAGAPEMSMVVATTTDAAGHFELAGLAAGLRSITAVAAGHNGRIISGLSITDNGDIGPITVKLKPTRPGEEPRLELTGIGAVISAKGEALVIGDTLERGGAREAGLTAGDEILAVDGIPVKDLGFESAIQRIRGPEGSQVVLSVRKGGTGAPINVIVTRRLTAS